jgi:hypothetical protein
MDAPPVADTLPESSSEMLACDACEEEARNDVICHKWSGSAYQFLQMAPQRWSQDRQATHQFLDGGIYSVDCGTPLYTFHTKYAQDLLEWKKNPRVCTIPAVTANHTLVFPMYADIDFKLSVARFGTDTVILLARIMTQEIQRFYPDADFFECIVCTKTGDAPLKDGFYKHGLHLHWPGVRLRVDAAKQIRVALVAALDRHADWSALGEAPIDWGLAVDESVYNGGLRMLGAPKAEPCKSCPKKRKAAGQGAKRGGCAACQDGHVYDPSVYELCTVVRGGDVDEAAMGRYSRNLVLLLQKVSVRCDNDIVAETPGFRVFPGCPSVTKAKKSEFPGAKSRLPVVTDPKKIEIVYAHLHRHGYDKAKVYSVRVQESPATTKSQEPTVVYKAYLDPSSEGAKWCANKRGDHNKRTVYLILLKDMGKYVSQMRCTCTCPATRFDQLECRKYKSPAKLLFTEERDRLFPHTATNPSSKLRLEEESLLRDFPELRK